MAEHRIHLGWERGGLPFTYETYSRNHRIRFKEGTGVAVSAAAPYGGDPNLPDPEDLLVAALSSCHMLSFLAIAAKKRLTVESYQDAAVGFLEHEGAPGTPGTWWVSRAILRPQVIFAEDPGPEVLAHMHERAHQACFIANSVKTDVRVEPVA
jgi:organic hydroperoxide reductase OsmC/OhrA